MNMDSKTIQTYLNLLNKYGVTNVELRVFSNDEGGNLTRIFSTTDEGMQCINDWLIKHNLQKQIVNCTFNKLSMQAITNQKPIKDSDIDEIRFLFVDIDPLRATKTSSTDNEKKYAYDLMTEVSVFIKQFEINEQIILDSGNGYHLLLPIENGAVLEVKELSKHFLKALAQRFNNGYAEVDVSVSNPARLGKLIGCVAAKGIDTEERPHRLSQIVKVPEEMGKSNTINSFKAVVDHISQENKGVEKQTASSNKTKKVAAEHSADYIYADPSNWLSSYPELKVSKKAGEIEGMTLYVFKECPLADPKHSNNQNGASLSVTKDGKVKFRCLHESHKELTIFDFAKKYPVPDSANLVRPLDELITVEGLEANHRYAYGRFQLTQTGVKMKTEKGPFVFIGNPIFINKLIKNIDTKEIEVEICFFINDEVETIVLGADILQINNFKHVVKYGYTFLSNHERDIVDYLNLQKEKLIITYEHSSIGWVLNEAGEVSYRSNKVFSSTTTRLSTLSRKSPFDLLPSIDSVTELDEFIENSVLDSDMELALCIGLAVLPHGYLKLTGRKDLSNIMVNFQGKSSTGKTAALKLISSLFGNPNSMVRNFNATNNAIINLASQSSGIPLIFDELGTANTSDLSSLFYQLSLGEEKLRMTTDRQLAEQQKFSLLTLMSSEEHVDCYLEKKLDGLLVRQLEFSDIAWTKSAEHAEKIKQFCNNNYGLLLENLMNKLFPNNLTSLQEYFEEANAYLSPKLSEHRLKDRICDNLALIYTGGLLAKRTLNYSIDLKRIEKHLITAYDRLIEDNSRNSQSVLHRVQEVIVQHAHKFVDGKGSLKRSFNSIYGKYNITKNGELKVNIFTREFERLLKKEFDVKDISYILKELLDEGTMQTEAGRRTKRVRINKQAMTTYEILLPMELKPYFIETEQSYTTSAPLFNQDIQAVEISEDDLNF